MDLASGGSRGISASRLPALATDFAQPGAHASLGDESTSEAGGAGSCFCRSLRCCHRGSWPRPHLKGIVVGPNLPGSAQSSYSLLSAEFALHQSLPIYAGGLGVLAGDHCKEASDL